MWARYPTSIEDSGRHSLLFMQGTSDVRFFNGSERTFHFDGMI